MNKQELIERIEGLKNLFGNKCEYIEIDAVIELASELDKLQKVTVPQFVVDWYEENKDDFEGELFRCVDLITRDFEDGDLSEFEEWFIDGKTEPFQTLVNMHQFGYEVEKEKRYRVKLKGIKSDKCYLNCVGNARNWIIGNDEGYAHIIVEHTRKELEYSGFGEVFDSPLFEIEEVK